MEKFTKNPLGSAHTLKDPIYNLKKDELRVIKLLVKGKSYTMSVLADLTDIPRTSLYPIIERLQNRNLIKRQPGRGGKISLRQETISQINNEAKQEGVIFHIGRENLTSLYEKLGEMAKKDRFYIIETTKSIIAMTAKIPNEKIIELNEFYGQNELIAEAILPESFLKQKIILLKEAGHSVSEYFKAMHERMYAVYTVPDELLTFNAEVLIVKNLIFLVNWEDDIAYEIRDEEITKLIKAMYKSFTMAGQKINFNEVIGKHL